MAKNTSNIQIWHRIIAQFNKARLDYIVVGAAALVMHGLPRSTLDIDTYIPATEDSLIKLFNVASRLKLKSEQKDILSIKQLPKLFTHQWICFSYKEEDVLDVFFCGKEEFKKLYKKSELKKDKDFTVRVASLNDISVMKKASGRTIDLADINLIQEARRIKNESKN